MKTLGYPYKVVGAMPKCLLSILTRKKFLKLKQFPVDNRYYSFNQRKTIGEQEYFEEYLFWSEIRKT